MAKRYPSRKRHYPMRRFGLLQSMRRKGRFRSRHASRNTRDLYLFKRISPGCTNALTSLQIENIVSNGVTGIAYSLVFSLNQLPNYTEFVALYDQYCIKAVKVLLLPQENVSAVGNAARTTPILLTAYDYNDASAIANEAQILEYETVKMHKFTSIVTRYLSPKPAMAVYKTPLTTGYAAPTRATWIECASPDIQHYGLKIFIPPCDASDQQGWRLYVTYYLSFRDIK